jgi:transcriptional regulator with XRE-family HTH domain
VAPPRIGALIRERREQVRRSQMDLAHDAGVSPRHLSFVELGKSRPSPELVDLLGDRLGVDLRRRNDWLLAAGYAPRHPESALDDDGLGPVRRSLQALLDAHDPHPAVVIDRRWTVQLTNRAAIRLARGIPDHARGVPTNIFRISLHPDGFPGRTRNFATWSLHLLRQLDAAVARTRDPELTALAAEAETWPGVPPRPRWARPRTAPADDPVVTWQVDVAGHELSLFTTMSVFAAPLDVTLSELAVELFFAADDGTERSLRALADADAEAEAQA